MTDMEQRKAAALERLNYEQTSDGRLTTNGYEIFDKETMDTIRAALQPSPVDAWRLIATSGGDFGDEEKILVAGEAVRPHTGWYVCVAWHDYDRFCTVQGQLRNQPTHWQPLPACPSDKSGV